MENGISISEKISALKDLKSPLKEKLNRAADLIYVEFHAKISVCELFGPRWSHIGGWQGAVVPELRHRLNNKYGIIAENIEEDSSQFKIISDLLLQILQ